MKEDNVVRCVLNKYELARSARITEELKGTHKALRVEAEGKPFVLKQYNQFMQTKDLHTQFLFMELIKRAGLNTLIPVMTADGHSYVQVGGRLWALFPWCEGRPANADRLQDLAILASTQGTWIRCCQKLRSDCHWRAITSNAQKFRQRKSWAWIVPLDRIPQFVETQSVIQRAYTAVNDSGYVQEYTEQLIALSPEVESSISALADLLDGMRIDSLPHIVTHGDFSPNNVRIINRDAVVLDFDCFSYEPRISDFARTAHRYYRRLKDSNRAYIFKLFQERALLEKKEVEILPLIICAYDLYYAAMHLLLFLEEKRNPHSQAQMIRSIEREAKAIIRYKKGYYRISDLCPKQT